MSEVCHFCQDTLTGTCHFQPCKCPYYYHSDCFHHQIKYQDSDGISAIQCVTCETYYNREYISEWHRKLCNLFQTVSQKFFWLYGGAQAVGGVITLTLWDPNRLVDSLATVSVLYNALLWTLILLTSCYLERPTTYRILAWWVPSLMIMVAIMMYPKLWLDWIAIAISGALLNRTRRDIFILSSEFHYQRVVSRNHSQRFEMEELGTSDNLNDNPIVHDFSTMVSINPDLDESQPSTPRTLLTTEHVPSDTYLDLLDDDNGSPTTTNTTVKKTTEGDQPSDTEVKGVLEINDTNSQDSPKSQIISEADVIATENHTEF